MVGNVSDLRSLVKTFLKLKLKREAKEKPAPYVDPLEALDEAFAKIKSGKPANLLRAVRYIEENLADPIKLDVCAKEESPSKYQFCRSFKRYFGISPMRFLNFLRLNRAKDLLCREDPNIMEVAMDVGFKDHGTFIKTFKK